MKLYVKVYTFYYKWDCRITTKLFYEKQPFNQRIINFTV